MEQTANKVSVKIYESDRDALEDRKIEIKRATKQKLDYADMIQDALQDWFKKEILGTEGASDPLTIEEMRLLGEFRSASLDKQKRMLATGAKVEELGPEVMRKRKAR